MLSRQQPPPPVLRAGREGAALPSFPSQSHASSEAERWPCRGSGKGTLHPSSSVSLRELRPGEDELLGFHCSASPVSSPSRKRHGRLRLDEQVDLQKAPASLLVC